MTHGMAVESVMAPLMRVLAGFLVEERKDRFRIGLTLKISECYSPLDFAGHGAVAQLGEHKAGSLGVRGSIPSAPPALNVTVANNLKPPK